MMERLKKIERDGYNWHSLPGGLDTVTRPKKEDDGVTGLKPEGKTSEDETKNR